MKRLHTQVESLSNGLTLVHVKTGPSCLFEASAYFNVGSSGESVLLSGVSHLLEHMMFRGSGRHATSIDFSRSLEALCGETNAFTSAESTEYWFQSAAVHSSACLELLRDFIKEPRFSEFETEKRIIEQEIDEDYNEAGKLIDDYALAMAQHFGPSGLGLPVGGTREGLKNLTLNHVQEHRQQHYTPGSCVITLISGEDSAAVLNRTKQLFSDWTGGRDGPAGFAPTVPHARPICQESEKFVAVDHHDNQFELRLSFASERSTPLNTQSLSVLERILDDGAASRLQNTLREELGLVYSISSQFLPFRDHMVFSINATVAPEHLERTYREIWKHLNSLRHQGPTTTECEHGLKRTLFELEKLEENHHHYLEEFVEAHFRGEVFSEAHERQTLEQVTPHSVQKAARQMFRLDRYCAILIGPNAPTKLKLLQNLGTEHG